jgi:hypothetical protein
MWVNYDSLDSTLFSDMATSGSREISIYGDPTRGNVQNGGTVNRPTLPSSLDTNEWYQISLTYDNSTGAGKLYINADEEASASQVVNPDVTNHSTFAIGRVATSGTDYFNGKIAIVKIYDTALTENQIEDNYFGYRNRFNLPPLTPTPTNTRTSTQTRTSTSTRTQTPTNTVSKIIIFNLILS